MYKLVIENEFIQKVVSKELAAGFRYALGIDRQDDYEVGEEEMELIFSCFEPLEAIIEDEELMEGMRMKLGAMLREIDDPDNAYTFDCLGEYLLYAILQSISERVHDWELEEDFSPWVSKVSDDEKKQVYNELLKLYKDEYQDEYTDVQVKEIVKILTARITNFPQMVDEPNDKRPMLDVLFWDRDFRMYEYTSGNIKDITAFIHQNAEFLGCVESDQNEPISGSVKYQ